MSKPVQFRVVGKGGADVGPRLSPTAQMVKAYCDDMPFGDMITTADLASEVSRNKRTIGDVAQHLHEYYSMATFSGRVGAKVGFLWGNPKTIKAYKEQSND
jgi:hypothetical protein